jgi:pimeloyl-ACP methyl ester carboxylesterase
MPNLDTSIAPAVNYHMVGKGPALVLLHGFPESSAIWQPIGAFLSQWYTVIMPDMPGVGATPYLQPASIADMAIIVKEILEELDIPKAVIYGHSMGGYIALAFAHQFPECVAGLSLIHSTPEADNEEKIINRRRVMEIIRNGGKSAFIEQMIPNLFATSYVARCPEIIQNGDGSVKNDCERNAAKRFIENFKREHPHLKVVILGDGIASNAPYIRLLENHKMKYILGAKPGDHQSLFNAIDTSEETHYHEFRDENGFLHQFRYLNDVALNKSNPDVQVNFLEYMQTDPKGKETLFSWVTNIHINQINVFTLMKGGRSRWKIENETFNTLKNLGYNFEHNYGHGKKYLSTILCLLMLRSFLIDQFQKIFCRLF